MKILERALELCRADQAMNETEAMALVDRETTEQFDGEAFARLLAATILGFEPSTVKREVERHGESTIHNVIIADGYETRDA